MAISRIKKEQLVDTYADLFNESVHAVVLSQV